MQLLVHRSEGSPIHSKVSVLRLLEKEKELRVLTIRVGEAATAPAAWPHECIRRRLIVEVVGTHKVARQDQLGDALTADGFNHFEANPGIGHAGRPSMG